MWMVIQVLNEQVKVNPMMLAPRPFTSHSVCVLTGWYFLVLYRWYFFTPSRSKVVWGSTTAQAKWASDWQSCYTNSFLSIHHSLLPVTNERPDSVPIKWEHQFQELWLFKAYPFLPEGNIPIPFCPMHYSNWILQDTQPLSELKTCYVQVVVCCNFC